jgi:hypothetical protein
MIDAISAGEGNEKNIFFNTGSTATVSTGGFVFGFGLGVVSHELSESIKQTKPDEARIPIFCSMFLLFIGWLLFMISKS